MTNAPLPDGATGIEVDGFIIRTANNKIVATVKESAEHYTLSCGSEVVDLHRTWRDETGEHHQTLFAITHPELRRVLQAFIAWPHELLALLRPLTIGWLHHHRISVVHGLHPTTDAELLAMSTKRHKRLVIDEHKVRSRLTIPEYLDAINEFPDGAFSLYKHETMIGVGFKKTDPAGTPHLWWLKLRDLKRSANRFERALTTAFQQASIRPEDYDRYPFLIP